MGSYKSKYSGEQIDHILDNIVHNNGNAPYIGENGNWFVHDVEKDTFVDSGEKASGADGKAGITPNIIIGEVVTVDNLADASVKRREGTPDETPILDFTVPRGVSGVYVGSGEMPEGYNIQVDPTGTESTVTISADSIYDLVINSQEEWDAAIASSFGGARNVLLNCDNVWVYDEFTIPATLKSISGNGNKISLDTPGWGEQGKIFNFNQCLIKDIHFYVEQDTFITLQNINGMWNCKVSCSRGGCTYIRFSNSSNIHNFLCSDEYNGECVFENCRNLYNCTIDGNANFPVRFQSCETLISCSVDCAENGGYSNCKNLVGCFACVSSDIYYEYVCGYYGCEQLVNCKSDVYLGYGYRNCSYLSNCIAAVQVFDEDYRDPSDVAVGFGGANTECDDATCKEIELV